MFISKKKFEEEVEKRCHERMCQFEERYWRDEKEREKMRFLEKLEERLIEVEKCCDIDHPSHHIERPHCY